MNQLDRHLWLDTGNDDFDSHHFEAFQCICKSRYIVKHFSASANGEHPGLDTSASDPWPAAVLVKSLSIAITATIK
ncbi:hypothetical protein [Peribacillus kribbensis]|uniref:hypothetical protein n=1 Tax=Peribacillus kribbensis TaxID=356658 RepID=UPI00040C6FA8|nr:hypothetical protein [Peribacillus kribbensis]